MNDAAAAPIVIARPEHAPALARIHYQALPDDFLPSLGREFLEQVYYPAALASAHAATFVALSGTGPIGFVTVAARSEKFSREVLRERWAAIARYALAASLRNPRQLRRNLEVGHAVLCSRPDSVQGEIVFIAVAEGSRGSGTGRLLVHAALAYLSAQGVPYCRTKTLASNAGVIRMYERMGWIVRNRLALIGRQYVVLLSPRLLDPVQRGT